MQTPRNVVLSVLVFLGLVLSPAGNDTRGDICKWVDDHGVTHYAERCPDNVGAEDVEVVGPLSDENIEQARKRSESLLKQSVTRRTGTGSTRRFRSLPLKDLGPLPENSTSIYLETVIAQYKVSSQSLKGQFFLGLRAREALKKGAVIEIYFPNPANPANKNIVEEVLKKEGGSISVFSPESRGFKCWNYEVEVQVYEDESKARLLDTHYQVIQSRLDLDLVQNREELVSAMRYGRCPSPGRLDFARMSAEELAVLCEAAREKHLKPMREKRIEQCKAGRGKSDEQCEAYWADFGDAVRTGPHQVRPALFYDLPECIAAEKARMEKR